MRLKMSIIVGLFGVIFAAAMIYMACSAGQKPAQAMTAEQMAAKGKYLVTVGSCNDCHTPKLFTERGPIPDTTRLLSGHPATEPIPEIPAGVIGPTQWGAMCNNNMTAWVGPWGVSFAANLTPDQVTGSGAWTEQAFIAAIRTGKHLGAGRDILPPMPWPNIAAMTDDDFRAMFAYLKSIKPIDNLVPAPIPPKAE